jgi:hypothetical protein
MTEPDTDDQRLGRLLQKHDPIASPTAADLTTLETRILSRIEAHPDNFTLPETQWTPSMLSQSWLVRGVCFAAVLFAVLGFIVGRDFDDLTSQSADSNALFASAEATPWQSFIVAPLPSGESDDATE